MPETNMLHFLLSHSVIWNTLVQIYLHLPIPTFFSLPATIKTETSWYSFLLSSFYSWLLRWSNWGNETFTNVYAVFMGGGCLCFCDEMTVTASTSVPSDLPKNGYHWATAIKAMSKRPNDPHRCYPWCHGVTKSMLIETSTASLPRKWGK